MRWDVALKLGRVSNLPTVWSNVLAASVLAGGASPEVVVVVALAMSLAYVGGMYLNDAFDRRIDAIERPERPIPSGAVRAGTVFAGGFGMLAASVLLLVLLPWVGEVPTPWAPAASGVALAALIVLYDAWHKHNPLSPLLMGLCRVGVYVTTALAVAPALSSEALLGALALLSYLIGLTYTAKQENLAAFTGGWPLAFLFAPFVYTLDAIAAPGLATPFHALCLGWVIFSIRPLFRAGTKDVPRAVVRLIAGIALLDALLAARAGEPGIAVLALGAFGATLALQRWVRGT